ncbi:unnamed protein product [Ostreobium quekettii]|uniref:Fungal lipase-type domain-containing protein n=1 Tax=Ostreobium quekettii TaxID=121088 RepID=A0A8S1J6Y8_9CHLO|nr:unnamed protein product [Ostreobium quekettii]
MECGKEAPTQGTDAGGGSGSESGASPGGSSRCSSESRGVGDRRGDVHLSVELVPDKTMKLLFRVVYCAIEVGFAALVAILAVKFTHRLGGVRSGRPLLYVNAVMAGLGTIAVWSALVVFIARLVAVNRMGLRWSMRRRRQVEAVLLETALMAAIDIFYLAPNLYALSRECGYFDRVPVWAAYFKSVCWGTLLSMYVVRAKWSNLWEDSRGRSLGPREDATLLDAPLWVHWPVAMCWGLYQVLIAAGHVSLLHGADEREFPSLCEENRTQCSGQMWDRSIAIAVVWVLWGLFALYVYYVRRGFTRLHRKSYDQYRWTFLGLRYDLTTGGVAFFFGLASHCLLFVVNRSSCYSLMATVFGYIPPELVFNALTVVNSCWYMPRAPRAEDGRFATVGSRLDWTETRQSTRRLSCGHTDVAALEDGLPSAAQQSFCFETAVKAYYWCEVVYEQGLKTGKGGACFSLDVAMGLYDLQHCEFVREKLDTNAFVAWNQRTIVVSFRGTHSATNLLTDLQLWRVPHLDPRGLLCLMTMPLVHKGFYQSWKTLSKSIVPMVLKISGSPDFDRHHMKMLLTGHSLGGAIAQLAAYDIRKLLGLREDQISVYTLGCPRVGNHAFAQDYSNYVPDTWHVVNNIDAISRSPKLWFLYKHTGHKAVINSLGHLIVSPTFLEMKLTSAIFKNSMADHLLASYRRSLSAVVQAQFIKDKGLPGGKNALAELMQKGLMTKVLGMEGRTVARLESLGSRVWQKQPECRVEVLLMKVRRVSEWLCLPIDTYLQWLCATGKDISVDSTGLESMDAPAAESLPDARGCDIEACALECEHWGCG